MNKKVILAAAFLAAGVAVALINWSVREDIRVAVVVPELSEAARLGSKLFNANCAVCHGANAGGSNFGPPLIHKIYQPGHHSDAAFHLAVKIGARAHHWRFGNMPARKQVSKDAVEKIIVYIRMVQRANGIN
jgi:mono/diheme cytochrome c family protein